MGSQCKMYTKYLLTSEKVAKKQKCVNFDAVINHFVLPEKTKKESKAPLFSELITVLYSASATRKLSVKGTTSTLTNSAYGLREKEFWLINQPVTS